MAEKDKIVRASDNSAVKRFVKKHFGVKYLKEMTDKELQQVYSKPDSVFGAIKNRGNVTAERSMRKYNLDKTYKDKVLRDHSKMLKDLESDKRYEKKRAAVTVKKATGGKVTKKKK